MKKNHGSLTVEAAIVLVIFIFGYISIASMCSFIRAQMIIQYSINQAAKDISAYSYLVSKTGLMEDSARMGAEADGFKKSTDNVIDTVVKLYDAIDQGTQHITNTASGIPENQGMGALLESVQLTGTVTQEEFQNMVTAANTMMDTSGEYFGNPKAILKGFGAIAKDGAFSQAKSYMIAAPISKALVGNQIKLYEKDGKGRDILEQLGVVGGMSGLNFTGSLLFNDGKTIVVQAAYTMRINYPGFENKEFHFIQTASTEAWGSKHGERPWRK